MKRLRFITTFLFLAPLLQAEEVQWPAKLGQWTASNEAAASTAGMFNGKPEVGAIAKESGFVRASTKTYRGLNSSPRLTLYTFSDSSGAYEACTFLRAIAYSMNTNNRVFVKSNLVLWVGGNAIAGKEESDAIESWLRKSADGTPSPPIATYLPTDPASRPEGYGQRYALGAVGFRAAAAELKQAGFADLSAKVGFNEGAEAMFAQYQAGKDEGVLLLLDYPTPQLATYHQKHLELGLSQISKLRETPIERRGSLLMMVLSPSSKAYAESLRSSVNYETQVTWNEPSHTITDPPWARVLERIFIGTGIFMVAAIALGIAFGGVRVVTKIFLPGKVFDRRERLEILQLGLSGKRIDPSDFY